MSGISVTILINNYNYGRYLGQAIESALTQDYDYLDVLVVDDGSTDNSREIIATYGKRIRSVLKPNGGQASAFNMGFAASDSDIVCLLDSDDWYLPNKVCRIAAMFAAVPDAGWVFHALQRNFPDGTFECKPWTSTRFVDDRELASRRGRLSICAPATSGLCFTRKFLDTLLPMPEDILITSDNYLKFAAMALAPGIYMEEALAAQRIHDNNAYTLRSDRLPMQARMHLLIAQGLKNRHPELRCLSDKVFSKAVADHIAAGDQDLYSRVAIARYLRQAGLPGRATIMGRIGYHYGKRHLWPYAKRVLRPGLWSRRSCVANSSAHLN
jgi:glycosyltransferase involved in cell wall biosynthesis